MSSKRERVEVSIFKEDVPTKTITSSIMNPRVKNGLGEVLFDLLRDLTLKTQDMSYNGPCFLYDHEKSSFSGDDIYSWEEDLNVSFENCLHLFGGSVYQIHASNDNSRYQNILPGVHDLDVLGTFIPKHVDTKTSNGLLPAFGREYIDDLLTHDGDILNQRGMLSFCLSEITRVIKNKLVTLKPKKFYYRYTSDSTEPNEVEILNAVSTDKEKGVLYQEIINDIFIYKIVDEGSMFKIQLEVTAKMGDLFKTDHVFELIMLPDEQYKGSICHTLQNIGGIFVESKKELFIKNMDSMSSRAFEAEKFKQNDEDFLSRYTIGKCALDVLRLCYLILTDLDNEIPWVTTPKTLIVFSEFDTDKHFCFSDRTPIELFIIFLQYVSPCVEKSGIKNFNLENSTGLEEQSVLMSEILGIFSKFSGPDLEKQSKLLGSGIKKAINNGKSIFKGSGARASVQYFNRTLQNKKTRDLMMNDFDLTTTVYLEDDAEYKEDPDEVSALIQNRRNGIYVTINDFTYFVKYTYVAYSRFRFKLTTNLACRLSHKRMNSKIEESVKKGKPLKKIPNRKQRMLGFLFGGGEEIEHVPDY